MSAFRVMQSSIITDYHEICMQADLKNENKKGEMKIKLYIFIWNVSIFIAWALIKNCKNVVNNSIKSIKILPRDISENKMSYHKLHFLFQLDRDNKSSV